MGAQHLLELPGTADSPAIARHYLSGLARLLGEPTAEALADLLVLTSELVTNAVQHGRPPITLEVRRTGSTVRVSAHDFGTGRPVVTIPDGDASSGRGLLIVETLARAWGVSTDPQRGGKTVWCEFSV